VNTDTRRNGLALLVALILISVAICGLYSVYCESELIIENQRTVERATAKRIDRIVRTIERLEAELDTKDK